MSLMATKHLISHGPHRLGCWGFSSGRVVVKTFNFLLAPKESFVSPTNVTRLFSLNPLHRLQLLLQGCPDPPGTKEVSISFYASFCHYAMSAMTLPTPRVFLLRLRNMAATR